MSFQATGLSPAPGVVPGSSHSDDSPGRNHNRAGTAAGPRLAGPSGEDVVGALHGRSSAPACSADAIVRYMSAPLSIRFDEEVLARLRRRAQAVPGSTPSGLAQRLVDEGLRMAEHPGIVFKDGPSGRRAALPFGPDVWEVVTFLREVDERGQDALDAAAEVLNLPEAKVRVAMHYYATHPDEIDAEVAQADEESRAAEAAWEAEQRLLA